MRDQLVAKTATYTTQNKQKRRTSLPSAGFESAIQVFKQLQTYALQRRPPGSANWFLLLGYSTKILCDFVTDRTRVTCPTHFHPPCFHERHVIGKLLSA